MGVHKIATNMPKSVRLLIFVLHFASAGITWLIVTLTMVGRLCISASWQVLYVWCVELFPTTVRVIMLQSTLIAGKIGNTVGSLVKDLV